MGREQIIIFGAAEIAELAHFYFSNDSNFEVVGFCVDDAYVNENLFCNLPVVPFSEINSQFPPEQFGAHVALSFKKLNRLRENKYNQLKAIGYELESYISSKSVYWNDLKIGDNCFILENQTLQPKVTIGNNVMLWSGNHIGDRTLINDHTWITSNVCIGGDSEIGSSSFLGMNCTISHNTKIGNANIIGAGTLITQNTQAEEVYIQTNTKPSGFNSLDFARML